MLLRLSFKGELIVVAQPYDRLALELAGVQSFPPLIRESLISDPDFRKNHGLSINVQISFNDFSVTFQRSGLYDCIREIYKNKGVLSILKDSIGEEWIIKFKDKDNKNYVQLSNDKQQLYLHDYSALSPDQTERLIGFKREADKVNLPQQDQIRWNEILSSRELTDDEIDSLHEDIKETPIGMGANIKSEIFKGKINLSSLVPRSERYFNRLVGEYHQHLNIVDHSMTVLSIHISQLISWRPYEGFLLALLLSSHSSSLLAVCIDQLKEDDFIRIFEWLLKNGDRVSQIGAIEIGLSILDKQPKIESYIEDIIKQIRDDDINDKRSQFNLLSALIILVEGELSRTKILNGKPPFWRRLASIAQASIIERNIISSHLDKAEFIEWAIQSRGQLFYLQTMTDLRCEPRWHPDYVSPQQLKYEFIGRIVNATQKNNSKINSSTLRELLFGEASGSLQSFVELPFSFLPGPLEGSLESQPEPPAEIVEKIEEQLKVDILQVNSFAMLANSVLIFHFDSHYAHLAVTALRAVKHHIKQANNNGQLFSMLKGLSTVAAAMRSGELAEEIKILIRKCRHESGLNISAEEAMWIGLIAAAAYSELKDWVKFLGEWVTELAFQPLQRNEMENLHSQITKLCHIVPELWCSCGKAEAALSACLNI